MPPLKKILARVHMIPISLSLDETPPSGNVPMNIDEGFFNFKSEYALLSNQHFLNCFMRGRKNIGSYYIPSILFHPLNTKTVMYSHFQNLHKS